jgi:hypothetical protein
MVATMALSPKDTAFIEEHPSAAMITVSRDGTPRAARVGIALVDGKLWSSGTQDRVRAKRLRRDPRCTLFVFEAGWEWLTLDTTVRIRLRVRHPALLRYALITAFNPGAAGKLRREHHGLEHGALVDRIPEALPADA